MNQYHLELVSESFTLILKSSYPNPSFTLLTVDTQVACNPEKDIVVIIVQQFRCLCTSSVFLCLLYSVYFCGCSLHVVFLILHLIIYCNVVASLKSLSGLGLIVKQYLNAYKANGSNKNDFYDVYSMWGKKLNKKHTHQLPALNFPIHSPLLLLLLLSCFVFFILPLIIPVNNNYKKSTWHNPPRISWIKPHLGSVDLGRSIPWCPSAFLCKFPWGLSQRALPGRNMPAVGFCFFLPYPCYMNLLEDIKNFKKKRL